ncbi:CNT_collapsed_G0059150.mRNA.1.CDS.1 [Saccharomyces cerevisiae]|nr:CNT_collapsed_G0059150.mRNA.1.CDS.1 [Saccharomyces cerevisiae]
MSMVDDPLVWATLPYKLFTSLDNIRWSLGAHNICFQNKFLANFFSLGQVLSTERFGVGPFQGSIDASIRLLSPDDTLDLEWTPHSEVSSSLKKVKSLLTAHNKVEAILGPCLSRRICTTIISAF